MMMTVIMSSLSLTKWHYLAQMRITVDGYRRWHILYRTETKMGTQNMINKLQHKMTGIDGHITRKDE